MSLDTCDVLVVGGGPAGSTCAGQLHEAGLDVLLMDKREFPRDKVCAGWITPAVVESLKLDLDDYAQDRTMQPIRGFRIGTIGGADTEVRYREPVSYGIRRAEFDHYLLLQSKARLALGESATSIVRADGGWLVNRRIFASMLVGAGGHFCPVACMLGSEPEGRGSIVVAQEVEFEVPLGTQRDCGIAQDIAQIWFCPDLKGYGWCFAKGDYLNIGLGREDSHRLPEHVEQFRVWLRERGSLPRQMPRRFDGHAYALYPQSRRILTDDGVLLVGDSAGLAYPRSGEGIRPAVESALMAAGVIRDAAADYSQENLAPYAALLSARFGTRAQKTEAGMWLPQGLRQLLAAKLLATNWFSRNVVVDQWFLHGGQRAMPPGQQPARRAGNSLAA